MTTQGRVLFLCPHHAAKSVIAAAYFDRLARTRGWPGEPTRPAPSPPTRPAPTVVAALRAEGIDVSGHRPRHVTREDLATADTVILVGLRPWRAVPARCPGRALGRRAPGQP